MEYEVGQELQFRKNIGINVWVDGILPAGQMGLKKTHLRVCINKFHVDLPLDSVSELFEEKKEIVEPEIIEEVVVLSDPKPKKRVRRKKKDA